MVWGGPERRAVRAPGGVTTRSRLERLESLAMPVTPILAAAGSSRCELLIQIFRIRGVDLEYGEATIGGSGGYRALDSTHPSAEGSSSHSVKL